MLISAWSSDVCSSDLKGCAMALAEEGVDLVINARTESELMATAEEIRKATGVTVTPVVADVTTPEGRKAILAACPDPDILVTNAGGPAPGNFRTDTRERWLAALEAQLLAHVEVITAVVRSEEHTSELQSLMRISYAVFCLK